MTAPVLSICIFFKLIAQVLAYKIDFNSTRMHASPCHDNLAAETFRGEAVMAHASRCAGEISLQPDSVGGRGCISDSGCAALHIGNNFVHAGNDDNVGRSLNQTGDTVAVAVDIDQLTAQGDGVGAHEKIVGKNGSGVNLP